MTFNYELFCIKLKALRIQQGYSEFELSVQANTHYSTYCSIEKGKRVPNFKTVIAIANALKTTVSELTDSEHTSKKDVIITNSMSKINSISNPILLRGLHDMLLTIKTHEGIK